MCFQINIDFLSTPIAQAMHSSFIGHDLLRALITIVESGSYAKAADQLHLTQAAVSLQVRRLEEHVGQALFEKEGRQMALTESGKVLLGYARKILALNIEAEQALSGRRLDGQIHLAAPQDIAEDVLPEVLKRFAGMYPKVLLSVRVDRNLSLLDGMQKAAFDVALAQSPDATLAGMDAIKDIRRLNQAKMQWLAASDFTGIRPSEQVPLVLLEPPCLFRAKALQVLEAAGIEYRLAYTTASLAGLRAAVEAGLGVTARMSSAQDLAKNIQVVSSLVTADKALRLPRLGSLRTVLYRNPKARAPGLDVLVDLLAAKVSAMA
jgi:DNA-binding transcriptional LysR family regulator